MKNPLLDTLLYIVFGLYIVLVTYLAGLSLIGGK